MANHRQLSPLYLTFALAFPLQIFASFFFVVAPVRHASVLRFRIAAVACGIFLRRSIYLNIL
jgi:hypothetical protein